MNLRTLLSALLIGLAVGAPVATRANMPMSLYLQLDRTDYVNAGVGGIAAPMMMSGGEGMLTVQGLSGTVTLALLYWNGVDLDWPEGSFSGGDGDYDQPNIQFDGTGLVGTRVASMGSNDCWPALAPSAALYRADVTARVQARGNGDYLFSGLADKPGHSANGLSLIVYFDDGNAANDFRVAHYEGMQSNASSMGVVFGFPLVYAGGPVDAIIHVSDGQSDLPDGPFKWLARPGQPGTTTPSTLQYQDKLYDGLSKFAGLSVPQLGHGRVNGPGLWDIRRMPLTALFGPAGHYTLSTEYFQTNDCVSLQVAQIIQPADPQPGALSPNPFDFGDVVVGTQSPVQRFTYTNLSAANVSVRGTPATTYNRFPIVAQTCSGQTLPAGGSCTIDVQFTPTAVTLPFTVGLTIKVNDTVFVVDDLTYYAELRGAGVPNSPFSRLEPTPRTCKFTQTAIGNTTAPIHMSMQSTGSLPLTVTNVRVFSGGGGGPPADFTILNTTCSGQTLPPGSGCAADIAFRPLATGTRSNTFIVDFTAADHPTANASVALTGVAVASGDTVFTNGFEVAECIQ